MNAEYKPLTSEQISEIKRKHRRVQALSAVTPDQAHDLVVDLGKVIAELEHRLGIAPEAELTV